MEKVWFLLFCAILNTVTAYPPPCKSLVYCYGRLLHIVQFSQIFKDSKTFVDMKIKHNYSSTLSNFVNFMESTNNTPTTTQVFKFVTDNFEEGDELEKWQPNDYNPNPKFLNKISNYVIKRFAEELIKLWPVLARKVKPEVIENPEKYSLIAVPNGFIVPGGRFREFYYWDSYWIIKGLLISEMTETARGMIDNFIHVIKEYGFVPNGGRVYYLDRSQPPLLTKMALEYYKHTSDKVWLQNNAQYLSQELHYWLKNKVVPMKNGGVLAHYSADSTNPRPESYREDYKTVSVYSNEKSKDELYVDIKSGAESGWDFSSRWFFDEFSGNNGNLSNIQTRRVIPVDLNAFLCEAFYTMSFFYSELNDVKKSTFWTKKGKQWQHAIQKYLWNDEDCIWYDYDLKYLKQRKYYYASNIAPLWSSCFPQHRAIELGNCVVDYLINVNALDTPGGISTSMFHTGEQWDYPNAWAPLQAIMVQGLQQTGSPIAAAYAAKLAIKWVRANFQGFTETGEMFEKYDVEHFGKYGGGGEYTVQSGFGWTNGVVLEFINKYYTGIQK